MGNTTKMYRYGGSTWALANQVYFWTGSAWQAASRIWRWDPTNNWQMVYSTPLPSFSNVVGSNSGLAVSGTVTTPNAAVSIGGGFSGAASYAWTFVSGSSALVISSSGVSNPSWTSTLQAAGTLSAAWQLLLTDTTTGATQTTSGTISTTWTNTETALSVSGTNGAGSITVASGPASGTVQTGVGGTAAGCTPSGGSGSYSSFSWTFITGDSGIGISSSSVQNPTWSKAMSAAAGTTNSTSATWQVLVTDSEGHTASTQITVTLTITSNQSPLSIGSSQFGAGNVDIFTYPTTYCNNVVTNAGAPIPGNNTIQAPSVSPTGGNGSYTYSWSFVSGDSGIAINSTTLQSPTFNKTMCTSAGAGPVITNAGWQCAVRDTSGNGPVTVNVSITLGIYVENE